MAQTGTVIGWKKRRRGEYIRRTRGEKIADAILNVVMILLLCFFLYPLLNMISISLSDEFAVLRADVTFYPIGFNPQAYDLILQSEDLWRSIYNSTFVALVGCVCSLIGLSLAAYPLAFAQFYGKRLYNLLILFTMWFQGGIIPLFLTMQSLGLYNSLWSLILNLMLSAYNVVIVRSYFSGLPVSIVESARIDGANGFIILFRLIIPLSKPVLATVALWVIVGHWNDYLNPLMFLSDRQNYTLQLILKELVLNAESSIHNISVATSGSTAGAAALGQQTRNAVLVVAMIPMVILYPFVQRYFVGGVTFGRGHRSNRLCSWNFRGHARENLIPYQPNKEADAWKKVLAIVLALAMLLSVTAAMAEDVSAEVAEMNTALIEAAKALEPSEVLHFETPLEITRHGRSLQQLPH